jgi:hypothetical protein
LCSAPLLSLLHPAPTPLNHIQYITQPLITPQRSGVPAENMASAIWWPFFSWQKSSWFIHHHTEFLIAFKLPPSHHLCATPLCWNPPQFDSFPSVSRTSIICNKLFRKLVGAAYILSISCSLSVPECPYLESILYCYPSFIS